MEQQLQIKCTDYASKVQDAALKKCSDQPCHRTRQAFHKLDKPAGLGGG
jgi:hypothetical protein